MKTILIKKPNGLITLICVTVLLISSCKKSTDIPVVPIGNMNIRVVNAIQGSLSQDFYQNSVKLSNVAVAYGEYTGYLTAVAGNTTLAFNNTGTTTQTASLLVNTGTNSSYTAYYYSDGSGAPQITGFLDDNTAPATGKAKVRFVNLGYAFSNTLNVVVSNGGSALVTGLSFNNATLNYSSIDPNVSLDFTVVGSGIVSTIPGSNFVAGKIYTVWFDATNSTTAKFHVITQN